MPGTSTSGVNRLRWWIVVVVVGVAVVLSVPVPVWAATEQASAFVTVRNVVKRCPGVRLDTTPVVISGDDKIVSATGTTGSGLLATAGSARGGAEVSGALQGAVPGSAASVAGAAEASGTGSATGAATDLSLESVAAPPAVLPWIVGGLLVLVVAGAARAYQRSPQRAATRRSRRPHDIVS